MDISKGYRQTLDACVAILSPFHIYIYGWWEMLMVIVYDERAIEKKNENRKSEMASVVVVCSSSGQRNCTDRMPMMSPFWWPENEAIYICTIVGLCAYYRDCCMTHSIWHCVQHSILSEQWMPWTGGCMSYLVGKITHLWGALRL